MKCKEITAVSGCHTDLLGAKHGVTIHYEYGTDAAGKTILVSTRYTDPDGNPVIGADATNTTVGVCTSDAVGVEFLVTRPTVATTISAGTRKSVSVTTISADVTINGTALPEGFSWHMASQDAGYINTQIDISGTDYIVTEAF